MLLLLPMVFNTMRRAASALWLALAVTAVLPALSINPDEARAHAEEIRATWPRPEASSGERQLIDYIVAEAETLGLPVSILDFSDFATGHSFSSVIEIVVPGDPESVVMVVTPLNHPEDAPADADGSASVAATLALMQAASARSQEGSLAGPTLRLVFAGAEFGEGGGYPRGTRRFLSDYFAEVPHALIYLEATGLPLVVETGGGGRVAPRWLVTSVSEAAATTGAPAEVRVGLNQLHRLGISDAPEALVALLGDGIPSVYVTSGETGPQAPAAAPGAVALGRFLGAWVQSFDAGVPSTWDRHYLLFSVAGRDLAIGEQVFVIVLLGLLMSTLLYSLLYRGQFARYLRTIGRNLWNLPVLFLLIFGFLTAATYLLELLLIARRFPSLWEYYPSAWFALKITLAVFFFTIAAQLLRHLPLSKNGSYYSAAALFVLFVDIIIFSVLNLSFSYYFIWAFFWAFIFSVVRSRVIKALALLVSPLFLVLVAAEVLRIPELALTRELLLSSRGDLLLSFITLPFLLMFIRLDFLVRHPVRGRRSFALRVASTTTGILVVGMLVFVLTANPFSPSEPQPIVAVESVDYAALERSLTLTSPAPIGDVRVLFAEEETDVGTAAREYVITRERLPDVLTVRLSYEDFLDRERGRLEIDAPQPIEELSVRFLSDEELVLFDVSFPFVVGADRRSAEVFIGRRPQLPIVVDFTLARGTAPSIEVVAESDVHPEPVAVIGEGIRPETRLRVRTRFD